MACTFSKYELENSVVHWAFLSEVFCRGNVE
jgi:hypothetical protein